MAPFTDTDEPNLWTSAAYSKTHDLVTWYEQCSIGEDHIRYRLNGGLVQDLYLEDSNLSRVCASAADNDRFVVCWSDPHTSNSTNIQLARINAGVPGAMNLVISIPWVQQSADVIPSSAVSCLNDASFVIVWQDEDFNVWLRRYSSDLIPVPLGADVLVNNANTLADRDSVTVTAVGATMSDATARTVVAWNSGNKIYYRPFNVDGSPQTGPRRLPTLDLCHFDQGNLLGLSGQHTIALRPDGRLAVVWRAQGSATYLNLYAMVQSLPTCLGDLNCDGLVGPGDLAILLGDFGPCPACPDPGPCPSDLNVDGVVNSGDLAILLGNDGPCP